MSPSFRQPTCRLTPRRRLALGGVVLTSTLLAGAFIGSPAMAAPAPAPITTKAALTQAFSDSASTSSIELGRSLTDDDASSSGTSDDVQTVPDGTDLTLDLHGYSLDLDRIVIGAGGSLTVTDSTQGTGFDDDDEGDGPALHVDATSLTGAATAVALRSGSTLHVTRATVNVQAGSHGAGIGSDQGAAAPNARLLVDGSASVHASGGAGGAGVGGAEGSDGIRTTVSGGSLSADGGDGGAGIGSGESGQNAGSLTTSTADSSVNYGYSYVYATGGTDAAGIGGGRGGSGAQVVLNSRGSVYAEQGDPTVSGATASAVGAGAGGSAFGSLAIGPDARLRLYSDSALHVPADAVVNNSGEISLSGTIDGTGTIANTGSIEIQPRYDQDGNPVPDRTDHIADSVTVKGHNYLVTLDPNGGTAGDDRTAHVYSTDFDAYRYTQPTASQRDLTFFSWNSAADGSGRNVGYADLADITGTTSADGQPVPLTVFAQYGHPVVFTGSTLPDAALGQAYDQAVPVTGDDADSFSDGDYDDQGNRTNTLPAGLSVNPSTGHVTGVPTEAGSYRVHIYASGDHTSADGYITIEVAGAPAIATASLPAATVGSTYSARLQATGKGTITYSISSGSLPAGLSLNPATGAITGTPTTAGPRALVLKAASQFGSSLQPLVIDVAAAPAAPVASAPAAPTLGAVSPATVKYGHRLDLAVSANSRLPVTYRVASGALPKGITLNAQTGVISGVAADEGTFTASITAASSAGAASTTVVITVPDIVELISTKNDVPDVKVGAGAVPLKVAGLQKGERWTVRVDGKVVKRGTMKKAGALSTSVHLKSAKKDTVHTVVIAGSRAVSDPAEQAATSVQVTSLAAKKKLKVISDTDEHGAKQVIVDRLAAGERVVVKEGSKVVAKGHADAHGDFAFAQKKAGAGTSRLVVHGATDKRTGRLTVKNPKG